MFSVCRYSAHTSCKLLSCRTFHRQKVHTHLLSFHICPHSSRLPHCHFRTRHTSVGQTDTMGRQQRQAETHASSIYQRGNNHDTTDPSPCYTSPLASNPRMKVHQSSAPVMTLSFIRTSTSYIMHVDRDWSKQIKRSMKTRKMNKKR